MDSSLPEGGLQSGEYEMVLTEIRKDPRKRGDILKRILAPGMGTGVPMPAVVSG